MIEEVHHLEVDRKESENNMKAQVITELLKDEMQYDELINSRMLLLEKMDVDESKRISAQIQREDSDVWLEF